MMRIVKMTLQRYCILHMSPPAAQAPPGAGKKKDLEVAIELVVSLDFHKGNVLIWFLLILLIVIFYLQHMKGLVAKHS